MATLDRPRAPAPIDDGPSRRGRWIAHDGVEGHRERVGHDRRLVGDPVGHGDEHGVVRRHQLRPRPGGARHHADVDAGADLPLGERPAQVDVPGLARWAERGDAPGGAAQPRVQHHPLANVDTAGGRSESHHLGHHLVARHVGERGEGGHRVVDVPVGEVAEHQLGVRTADPREDRPGDHPVRVDRSGVVEVVEAEGEGGEMLLQVVGGDRAGLVTLGSGPEDECFHDAPDPASGRAMAAMPAMNPSMSWFFISTTARMSGM